MREKAETLTCATCGRSFGWPIARQRAFDYLGFTEPPRRCRRCRRCARRLVARERA